MEMPRDCLAASSCRQSSAVKADRPGAAQEGRSANLSICAGDASSDAPPPKGVSHSPFQPQAQPASLSQTLPADADADHPGRSDPRQPAPHSVAPPAARTSSHWSPLPTPRCVRPSQVMASAAATAPSGSPRRIMPSISASFCSRHSSNARCSNARCVASTTSFADRGRSP